MIELEKTYLAKFIPDNIKNCKSKEIIDIYIPKVSEHPQIRLRKNGDKFEITKKSPVKEGDASCQQEQTISLTELEFNELAKLEGKRICKVRYFYDYNGRTAEIDIFKELLEGLVLVDFEFDNSEEKDNFQMPDFCLADVTQEKFIAGGMLCGKSYKDIEERLGRLGYCKLI